MNDSAVKFIIEVVGMLEVNCYLVFVEKSKTLYIIDPGSEADKIIIASEEFDFDRTIILLTHAHVDHIGAIGQLIKELPISKVCLHEEDMALYNSPDNHLKPFVPPASDLPQVEHIADEEDFEVLFTPGHTRGGVCYYFKQIPALFTGDTLFCQSIGRTDLPGGDIDILMKSIKEGLFNLPNDLKIYPGHGPSSTIGDEKAGNPYLK